MRIIKKHDRLYGKDGTVMPHDMYQLKEEMQNLNALLSNESDTWGIVNSLHHIQSGLVHSTYYNKTINITVPSFVDPNHTMLTFIAPVDIQETVKVKINNKLYNEIELNVKAGDLVGVGIRDNHVYNDFFKDMTDTIFTLNMYRERLTNLQPKLDLLYAEDYISKEEKDFINQMQSQYNRMKSKYDTLIRNTSSTIREFKNMGFIEDKIIYSENKRSGDIAESRIDYAITEFHERESSVNTISDKTDDRQRFVDTNLSRVNQIASYIDNKDNNHIKTLIDYLDSLQALDAVINDCKAKIDAYVARISTDAFNEKMDSLLQHRDRIDDEYNTNVIYEREIADIINRDYDADKNAVTTKSNQAKARYDDVLNKANIVFEKFNNLFKTNFLTHINTAYNSFKNLDLVDLEAYSSSRINSLKKDVDAINNYFKNYTKYYFKNNGVTNKIPMTFKDISIAEAKQNITTLYGYRSHFTTLFNAGNIGGNVNTYLNAIPGILNFGFKNIKSEVSSISSSVKTSLSNLVKLDNDFTTVSNKYNTTFTEPSKKLPVRYDIVSWAATNRFSTVFPTMFGNVGLNGSGRYAYGGASFDVIGSGGIMFMDGLFPAKFLVSGKSLKLYYIVFGQSTGLYRNVHDASKSLSENKESGTKKPLADSVCVKDYPAGKYFFYKDLTNSHKELADIRVTDKNGVTIAILSDHSGNVITINSSKTVTRNIAIKLHIDEVSSGDYSVSWSTRYNGLVNYDKNIDVSGQAFASSNGYVTMVNIKKGSTSINWYKHKTDDWTSTTKMKANYGTISKTTIRGAVVVDPNLNGAIYYESTGKSYKRDGSVFDNKIYSKWANTPFTSPNTAVNNYFITGYTKTNVVTKSFNRFDRSDVIQGFAGSKFAILSFKLPYG